MGALPSSRENPVEWERHGMLNFYCYQRNLYCSIVQFLGGINPGGHYELGCYKKILVMVNILKIHPQKLICFLFLDPLYFGCFFFRLITTHALTSNFEYSLLLVSSWLKLFLCNWSCNLFRATSEMVFLISFYCFTVMLSEPHTI